MSELTTAKPLEPQPSKERLWRPRSLCFMLPLQPGDRLAVIGPYPEIAKSARKAEVSTVTVMSEPEAAACQQLPDNLLVADSRSLPLADAFCDHLIIPSVTEQACLFDSAGMRELHRVLRPGGHMFIGAPWRLRRPRHPANQSIRGGCALLRRGGFEHIQVYGIGHSLSQPRFIVPVHSMVALRWYRDAVYLPKSWQGALSTKALRWLPVRLSRIMFPDLGFVARRGAASAAR